MTSGGKVRIYELSRDLGLDNRDVLNAAEKLSIAAKSHSSSISDGEAAKIKALLNSNGKAAGGAKAPAFQKVVDKESGVLCVKTETVKPEPFDTGKAGDKVLLTD
ncbi:MAG: translation initiation factor IF-2 N-terminal domain-containing protein, partial [Prochlorococcaceae cyanobacterium]